MTTLITSSTARPLKNWPIAVQFPEVENGLPLHPKEIIARCPDLRGRIIATLSEHIILYFLREIREGRLPATDFKLLYVGTDGSVKQIRVDKEGELLDPFPGGFFAERGDLLFTDKAIV